MKCTRILLFSTLACAAPACGQSPPLLFVGSTVSAAETPDLSVPLPPGETLLADVGMYRVSWQSYGQEPVAMPVSWSGHFEPQAGISYQDWGRVLDRRALLLHSPWHVPPGKTWADYELALPRSTPIKLKFGIAMGPDVARPDRSDGVEAQIGGGEDHAPLVDFDLLKIHPQMVNHGMGYYERWFRRGYDHRWGDDTGTMEQIDKYRAQELAYGHAGFIGAAQVDNVPWVIREHHLMHPVQRLYGTARPVEIRYEVDGQFVTASAALVASDTSRQRIRYDSGLRLWVNWRAEPWHVESRVLPQWGFLALGPDTEVSTTLREGKWADYAECPDYVFADARTYFPMPYRQSRKAIEPRLREFKYLGGNRARVTYEWQVNDTLDRDYLCFVHGVHTDSLRPEGIDFQQDHALPKPTIQWRKGDVIVDGPYDLSVPNEHDVYDLVMGLYRGQRVRLKGVQSGGDRILVARLKLQRQDGKITNIAAEKITLDNQPKTDREADFTAHLNPPGTWIEFDKVATDGSVKIQREREQLIVFPYPRDKCFRVSLDLQALAPSADPQHIEVVALAAGTQQPLGAVDFTWENGRVVLTVGTSGAGRYVVTWKRSTVLPDRAPRLRRAMLQK